MRIARRNLAIYGYRIETSPPNTGTLCHKFLNQILCKIVRGIFVGKLKISHRSYCSHKMLATLIILVAYRTLVKHKLRNSIAHQDFSVITYDHLAQHPTTKIETADVRSSDPSKDPDCFFVQHSRQIFIHTFL